MKGGWETAKVSARNDSLITKGKMYLYHEDIWQLPPESKDQI